MVVTSVRARVRERIAEAWVAATKAEDLPGLEELKGAGLLDARLPPGFAIPLPTEASEEENRSLVDENGDEINQEAPEFHVDFLEDSEDIG